MPRDLLELWAGGPQSQRVSPHVKLAVETDQNDQNDEVGGVWVVGGIEGAKASGDLVFMVPSGYVAQVDTDICSGCGTCAELNNFNCITMDNDENIAVINETNCMGCGGCEGVCPEGALSLRLDPTKGDPLDLEKLKEAQ